MRYVVTALAYSEVMSLKQALAAQDIEAGVTVGALAIYPGTEQVGLMYAICCEHGTRPYQGFSLAEDLGAGRITLDEVIEIALEAKN